MRRRSAGLRICAVAAIAKKIAAPFQLERRFDFHAYLFDTHVVTFARSNHQAMGTKTDSFLVKIGRIVNNVQPAHRLRFVEFVVAFAPSVPLTQKEIFDHPIKLCWGFQQAAEDRTAE